MTDAERADKIELELTNEGYVASVQRVSADGTLSWRLNPRGGWRGRLRPARAARPPACSHVVVWLADDRGVVERCGFPTQLHEVAHSFGSLLCQAGVLRGALWWWVTGPGSD
ncbi:hypothetical protein [Ornithinimicrobium kibberense]|uniref:hypothetical protein n=1 Tax=Ornithinimicrobium kibberense TaxID=282060 RepID=UPI003611B05F